jgi:hypothetical protein
MIHPLSLPASLRSPAWNRAPHCLRPVGFAPKDLSAAGETFGLEAVPARAIVTGHGEKLAPRQERRCAAALAT